MLKAMTINSLLSQKVIHKPKSRYYYNDDYSYYQIIKEYNNLIHDYKLHIITIEETTVKYDYN